MRILAFDTAGKGCTVTLWCDGVVEATDALSMTHGQAESLIPMIGAVCRDKDWSDIDRVAVTVGPGSFTGLRVGLATAHGLALARGCPVVGVSRLETFAFGAMAQTATPQAATPQTATPQAATPLRIPPMIIAIIDARRRDVYVQPFTANTEKTDVFPLADPQAYLPDKLPSAIAAWRIQAETPVFLAGDAVDVVPPLTGAVTPLPSVLVDGAILAALAARRDPTACPPRPLYIRSPDATLPRHGGRVRPPHRADSEDRPGGDRPGGDRPEDKNEITITAMAPGQALSHASVCAALHAQSFAKSWDEAAFSTLLSDPAVSLWVAMAGQTPAAFLLVRSVLDEAEILTLGTTPCYRRQGLARALLRSAFEHLQNRAIRRLFLDVATDNEAARSLYHALGFTKVGYRKGYYAPRCPGSSAGDALIMAHDLPPPFPSS